MSDCSTIKPVLPLFLDGEVESGELRKIEAHLAFCPSCREEHETFLKVISTAREAMAVQVELPVATRRKIAIEAARRASRPRWPLAFPAFALPARSAFLLTGVAAILLALLTLPVVVQHRGSPAQQADVSTIRVTSDGQAVRLAWSDGTRESYTVYKSYDPRSLRGAEVHVVKGNVWIDRDSARSPIVFYRVE